MNISLSCAKCSMPFCFSTMRSTLFVPVPPFSLVERGKLCSNSTLPATLFRSSILRLSSSVSETKEIMGAGDCVLWQASRAFSKMLESIVPSSDGEIFKSSGTTALIAKVIPALAAFRSYRHRTAFAMGFFAVLRKTAFGQAFIVVP